MRTTNELNKTKSIGNNVGSGALKSAQKQKGITLIALIITIIVMLILVAVTINMAINGGLFEQAGRAVNETQDAINREQQLADGRIKVGDKWYASIDDYLAGKELIELPEGIKVGDYVNYTPDTGTYKVASGETGSGYTSEQSFTTEVDNEEAGTSALKWRILSINEETGEIELVSATAGQTLTLQGANGYNHAVDILNDLCESLYSKTENGTKVATGRSINVEDINAKTTFVPSSNTNYGTIKALSDYSTNYRKYPNLYERETGYAPAGTAQTGLNGSVGLKDGVTDSNGLTTYSTVTGYTDDYDSSTSSSKKDVRVTFTDYYYKAEDYLDTDLGINTAPTGLLNVGDTYWLASRCVNANSSNASFDVRCVRSSGRVGYDFLSYSGGIANHPSCAVRPVVSLGSNVSLTKDAENSNESVTYWNIEF